MAAASPAPPAAPAEDIVVDRSAYDVLTPTGEARVPRGQYPTFKAAHDSFKKLRVEMMKLAKETLTTLNPELRGVVGGVTFETCYCGTHDCASQYPYRCLPMPESRTCYC